MKRIPVIFAIDKNVVIPCGVTITSLLMNAGEDTFYDLYILYDGAYLGPGDRKVLADAFQGSEKCTLSFVDVEGAFKEVDGMTSGHITTATYYRLEIPTLFPQYDKVIYLDADLVVPGDISELYQEHLGTKLVGAVADYSIQKIAPFMRYIDRYVGVDHQNYVNSGVLLLNSKRLREVNFAGCFLEMVSQYGLETVAPDQDYLNALCRYGIHYLDPEWNAMPSECMGLMDDPQIVHFNLGSKPWLNESVPYDEIFWKYAALSGYEKEIRFRRRAFLQDTNAMKNYKAAIKKLIHMAARLTEAPVSFRTLMTSHQTLRLCS